MNIVIIGSGYVGLVTGTCFAEMGNNVSCVDVDKDKIYKLNNGEIPIYEPGLDSIISHNINEGRLSFTTRLSDAIINTDFIFIAVGTPENNDGSSNLKYVYAVAEEIGDLIDHDVIVVNKSTVPVGTGDNVRNIIYDKLDIRKLNININVVSNPEFLKEGDAIRDFMHPDRIVIGTDSQFVKDKMTQLYSSFSLRKNKIIFMSIKEAELTKYASNAMLATKISFINEISVLCDSLDIDIENIRQGIGSDKRIGYSFIYPGCGYGGSCFPKDVKSLINTFNENEIDPLVLNSIVKRNDKQKKYLFDLIKNSFGPDLSNMRFAIWGLSFKPGTDDIREAPSIDIVNSIINANGFVSVYDPVANNNFKNLFDTNSLIVCDDMYQTLDSADALLLLTEWKQFRNPDFNIVSKKMNQKYIFDGRNQYNKDKMQKLNFIYKGIGR